MKYQHLFCLMALTFTVGGCSGAPEDYCKAATGCRGGNELEQQACLVDLNTSRQIAAVFECSDKHDIYENCVFSKTTCQDGFYSRFDGENFDDRCEVELRQLNDCVNAVRTSDDN
jgi:hypothetical protein